MEENNKQHLLDERYLRMARIWGENSYCKRRQVGALIVKEKMIKSSAIPQGAKHYHFIIFLLSQ